MKVKIYSGDILMSPFSIYAHGVNCKGVMGGGIAKHIKHSFPANYTNYLSRCVDAKIEGINLCGTVLPYLEKGKYILNCFTQFNLGADAKIEYIEACLEKIILNVHALKHGTDVVMPIIGCGIGGIKLKHFKSLVSKLKTKYVNTDVTFHIILKYVENQKLQELPQ